jgi:hypothetical protein
MTQLWDAIGVKGDIAELQSGFQPLEISGEPGAGR